MAGIAGLYDEYKRNPDEVEKLLNSKIEISENLDGSRFSVQVHEGGRLEYYKRNDSVITRIDRTLARYYEKAIYHFDTLPSEVVSQLPLEWKFGMEYFPNLQPVKISYDRMPLNNLVLTDIQVKESGKSVNIITDKETLNKWAKILVVESPPVIFEGKLSSEQKMKILAFLNTPASNLTDRFKTESFTKFFLNLLNPKLKTAFLHDSDEKQIEGLIFRFDGKSLKLSDPEVVISRKTARDDEKPSDIYNLTLVFLQEFLIAFDFKKIKLKGRTFEERYIEFISRTFNLFVKSPAYAENFAKGVDFELPKFLTREEASLNFDFVEDPDTQALLQKSSTNRELFKIMLASFRSHKKKPNGFFTKELVQHHNELVDKIANFIDAGLKESFLSFDEFRNVFMLEETNQWEEFGNEFKLIEGEEFPTFSQVKKSEAYTKVEAPVKTLMRIAEDEDEDEEKSHGVCVMTGKFKPIHNGHITVAEDTFKDTGLKTFLVVRRPADSPFSEALHRRMLEEVISNNDCIEGYCFTDGRSWSEMQQDMPKGIKGECFAGSTDQCDNFRKQTHGKVKMLETTAHFGSKTVMNKLKGEDYEGYKKLVPKPLHNFFYKMRSELSHA